MRVKTLMAAAAIALTSSSTASAQLTVGDFLNTGDHYLVTDQATDLARLSPLYTRNHTFNDAYVQGITSTYGFRYATAAEVLSMINLNFGNPVSSYPGDAAGFASADAFFNTFGIAEMVYCQSVSNGPFYPCPRTQGLTSDVGTAGRHQAFGMIQYGTNGYSIVNTSGWSDTVAQQQIGSWLVADLSTTVAPEPATLALMMTGLGTMALTARVRRKARGQRA